MASRRDAAALVPARRAGGDLQAADLLGRGRQQLRSFPPASRVNTIT
jgi:hypothetical protein